MHYVTGLFETAPQADEAIRRLEKLGVRHGDISVITTATPDAEAYIVDGTDEGAGDGVGVGAAAGGLTGLLAGAALLAVPGVGPALAVGWLVAAGLGATAGAAVGSVAGGIVGSITGTGISHTEAHALIEEVRKGSTLVMARVKDHDLSAAGAILKPSI